MKKRKRNLSLLNELDMENEDFELEEESTDDMEEEIELEIEELEEFEDENEGLNEEDDLLVINSTHFITSIKPGKHKAIVEEVNGLKQEGWVRVTINFRILGKNEPVSFVASSSMYKGSRLYPIVTGILNDEPSVGFSLGKLRGKEVLLTIENQSDQKGNIWPNVVEARGI